MRRYVILAASLIVQLCLGGLYAWSVFVPHLVTDHGLTTTHTQAVFGTTIAVFTAVMVYSGRIVERRGPRPLTIVAGLLFAAGYAVAAGSDARFAALVVGIGVLAGAGIGMGYVCPLTVSMKWFPRHKGLVTGVTVAGFGGGAVLLSAVVDRLFTMGASVPDVFLVVGLVYGAAIATAGLFLAVPEPSSSTPPRSDPVSLVIRQPLFWGLTLGMFAGTFAGLMVIGNLKPLGLSEGVAGPAATAAISALAVGNAGGRITWGWLHDRLGRSVIPASLLLLGAAVLALPAMSGEAAFIIAAAVVGFGFGACFVLYAAEVASHWGVAHVGSVYPLMFLAYGLSGILGPVTGGWLYDATGEYASAVVLAAVLTVIGAVAVAMLRPPTAAACEASADR